MSEAREGLAGRSSQLDRRGRILLVDDSALVRRMLGDALRAAGHAVDEAPDGLAALTLIETNAYDVILSDLHMPRLDGFGLLEAVKATGVRAQVVILTAEHAHDPEAAIRALRLGADDFLSKPLRAPDEVVVAVARALERRRESEVRRAEQERYRLLFERNLAGVYRTTLDGRFLEVNEACAQMLGFASPSEMSGVEARQLSGEEQARVVTERLQKAGAVPGMELRLRRATGDFCWVLASMAVVAGRCPEDSPLVEGTLIDITERKRAESRLATQLVVTRVLMEAAGLADALPLIVQALCQHGEWDLGAAWLPDRDGALVCAGVGRTDSKIGTRFEVAARGPSTRTGESLSERVFAAGHPIWVAQLGDDDASVPHVAVAIEHGLRSAVAFPVSWRGAARGVIECFSREAREPDEALLSMLGDLGSQIGQFLQRKSAEEALEHRERLLRTIIDADPQCVKLVSTEGTILEMNAAGLRIVEADSLEEMSGKPFLPLVVEEDRAAVRDLVARTAAGGNGTLQFRIRSLKGNLRWMDTNAVPLRDELGQLLGVLGFSQDITAHREAEEALKRSEAQLRQVLKMEAVGRLAGGIAHDFNNLLSVILGYCDLIRRRPDIPPEEGRRLDQIRKAADRAATLTRQLLAFSRKQVLQPEVITLESVVNSVEPMLRRLIGEDIQLVTLMPQALWPVHADPVQLEEVLLNLALNARDAMPMGGRLTIETANVVLDDEFARTHPGARPGRYAMMAVRDTGHGMDEATLQRVFEPFFTTKETGKGTGLGLAMAYGIVKQSDGYIEAESTPGAGTTFRAYVPRTTLVAGPAVDVLPLHEQQLSGSETILVVEDEDGVREVIREMLQSAGYSVLEAKSAENALEIARLHRGPIHCVLTDVVMPRMDGFQLAAAVRTAAPNTRVVYMSGYSDQALLRRRPAHVGDQILPKPISRERLLATVREILDRS
jgi:two-component system, cell cycle sensor histidine kinase and response regulator CckA